MMNDGWKYPMNAKEDFRDKTPLQGIKEQGQSGYTYAKTCLEGMDKFREENPKKRHALQLAMWYVDDPERFDLEVRFQQIDGDVKKDLPMLPEVYLRKAMQTAPSTRRDIEAWNIWLLTLDQELKAALIAAWRM